MKRIAKYETNDASIGTLTSRISHALLNKKWSEIGDWVLDNLKTFKELIDLTNKGGTKLKIYYHDIF